MPSDGDDRDSREHNERSADANDDTGDRQMGILNRGDDRAAELERQREHDQHQQMQRAMFQSDGKLKKEYLDELTQSGIPEQTVYHLRHLMTRDFVLSKLDSAEKNEIRWIARELMLELDGIHPPKDSVLQGEYRAYLSGGDPRESLVALTDADRLEIEEFVMVTLARVARGEDGWQQEMMNKQYTVSETVSDGSEKKRGLFS